MPRDIEQITGHVDEAFDRLLQQYKDDPSSVVLSSGRITNTWGGFLDALVSQLQDLEDTIFDVLASRALLTAQGEQLDIIGSIVGQDRPPGTSDDDYRILVIAKIFGNNSDGTAADIINVTQTLFPGATIRLVEVFPAGIDIQIGTSVTIDPLLLEFIYDQAKAAGIKVDFFSFVGDAFFGFKEDAQASAFGVRQIAYNDPFPFPNVTMTGFGGTWGEADQGIFAGLSTAGDSIPGAFVIGFLRVISDSLNFVLNFNEEEFGLVDNGGNTFVFTKIFGTFPNLINRTVSTNPTQTSIYELALVEANGIENYRVRINGVESSPGNVAADVAAAWVGYATGPTGETPYEANNPNSWRNGTDSIQGGGAWATQVDLGITSNTRIY